MGGGCRETYNVRRNPRVLLRSRTWRYNKRVLFDDNVMWIVCAVLGHVPYNTSMQHEPSQHACRRCHRWLPALDVRTILDETPAEATARAARVYSYQTAVIQHLRSELHAQRALVWYVVREAGHVSVPYEFADFYDKDTCRLRYSYDVANRRVHMRAEQDGLSCHG